MSPSELIRKTLAFLAWPLWRVLRYCDTVFGTPARGAAARRADRHGFASIGEDCVVSDPLYVSHPGRVRLGSRVSIAPCVLLSASNGAGIEIGDDTMIAAFAILSTTTHDHRVPNMRFAGINRPIVIGRGCWVGLNAIILPGVSVGDGAVIGAGAVVTKDVEPNAIVVGVPARLLKYRGEAT